MKKINDDTMIQKYIQNYQLQELFITVPEMTLFQFEKDEILNHKLNPEQFFLFLVQGKLHLTNIREDGTAYQILNITALTCLGDIELFRPGHKQYTITSDTTSLLLAIDLHKYHEELTTDYRFLQYLLKTVIHKLDMTSSIYAENETLKERVLQYARNNHNQITEIEKTANQLCCSRRQLQRIIKELIEEGTLLKVKKGKYIVTDEQ